MQWVLAQQPLEQLASGGGQLELAEPGQRLGDGRLRVGEQQLPVARVGRDPFLQPVALVKQPAGSVQSVRATSEVFLRVPQDRIPVEIHAYEVQPQAGVRGRPGWRIVHARGVVDGFRWFRHGFPRRWSGHYTAADPRMPMVCHASDMPGSGPSAPSGRGPAPRRVTIRLNRRAYSPVLRQADLPADTTVPWRGNRTLHYEYT